MKGGAAFFLGLLVGAALTIGAYWFMPLDFAYEEINDLRARVADQAREIESQRRQLSTQTEASSSSGSASLATAVTDLRPRRSVDPPISPRASPAADAPIASAPSRLTLEFDYADLINTLHLTSGQRLTFLDLLGGRDAPGGTAALRRFFERPADYLTFQAYVRDLPERRSVRALRIGVERIARPLSAEQERALIAIFGRDRKARRSSRSLDEVITANPRDARRLLADYARVNQRVLAEAAAILTPEQLEVLRRLQSEDFQRLKLTADLAPSPGN